MEIILTVVCIAGIGLLAGCLIYAARHGTYPAEAVPEKYRRLAVLWKAGDLLAIRIAAWKRAHGRGDSSRKELICSELNLKEPGADTLRRHEAFRYGTAILIAGAALLLGLMASLRDPRGNVLTELPRNGAGGGEVTYELWVSGLGEEDERLRIEVNEQRYQDVEALFDAAAAEAAEAVFSDGDSVDGARHDLSFPSALASGLVRASWEPVDPELIAYDGTLNNAGLAAEGEITEVWLTMTYEDEERMEVMEIRLLPPVYTEEEARLKGLEQALEESELASRDDERFILPDEWEGRRITFIEDEGRVRAFQILALGAAAAVCWFILADRKLEDRAKLRTEQMQEDYPEVVLQLAVLLRAGLTLRSAWERIVEYYRAGKQKGGERRYAYEEMQLAAMKMQGGRSEAEGYLEFGRRTHLQCYLKLGSLLEQNLKKGGKNLVLLLETETGEAWHEKKNAALKKGEEAGTKLLLPMLLTMIVVLIVIMAPAMLGFYT